MVLCVVIESRHDPDRHFSLPVLSRLYLNKKAAAKWNRKYRPKNELMLEMVNALYHHLDGSQKRLH